MPRTLLTEARPVAEATPVAGKPGRFLIQLISPGLGSSGYYSPDVLQAAAEARVFPAGLHGYIDHPRRSDETDLPERSVRDLASVLTEDARWTGDALVAEAMVFGPYREVLEQMRDAIGVSIRAYAETSRGDVDGDQVTVIDSLVEGVSADFVTHAGRGGRIVEVLESARPSVVNRRAVEHGIAEATANDTREALQTALRDAYGGEDSWVWVRDFDDSTVWYEHETPDDTGTYAEGYSLAEDGSASLAGERTEVHVRTTYVPVTRPDSTTTTEESEEDTMPEIAESELTRLREDAGRVQTLESERDAAVQRAETAETERDTLREANDRRDRAATVGRIVNEAAEAAGVDLDDDQRRGIASRAVFADDGSVNEAETRRVADERVAAVKEAAGAGRPRGLGHTQPIPDTVTEADLDALDDAVFGNITQEA